MEVGISRMTLEQVLAMLRTGCVHLAAKYGLFNGEYSARLTIISPTGNLIPDEITNAVQQHQAILYLAALHSYTTICPAEAEHRPLYTWVVDPRNEEEEYEVCDACARMRQDQLRNIDTFEQSLLN